MRSAMETRSNQEWLRALRSAGEEQAAAIVDLHSLLLRAAVHTCRRNMGDLAHHSSEAVDRLAEDCAQEALLLVLKQLDEFRGSSRFTTWAYKFAINVALTTTRREHWRGISLDALVDQPFQELKFIRDQRPNLDPETSVLRADVTATIAEVIRTQLTERQRLVLKLMVFDEVPMDVVTEYLGANRNAVYKLLHDARRKLKSALELRGVGINDSIDLFT